MLILRLYNLDVFEYELNERMALYASVPFLMAPSAKHTAGLFWLNAAETWVDVDHSSKSKSGILGTLSGMVGGGSDSEVSLSKQSNKPYTQIRSFTHRRPSPSLVFFYIWTQLQRRFRPKYWAKLA